MGRAPCCDKTSVKRGPWSPEEDSKLKEYIEKHGTGGNWISLPNKAGLKRCGKSCRLRWLNYLRPNIKHGDFSDEEDRIICSLYVNIGSRWSVIAAQLPGRTDNDIKNYWNTKLKKKLMGLQLPISHQRKSPFPPSPNSSHPFSLDYFSHTPIPFTNLEPISLPSNNNNNYANTIFAPFYQNQMVSVNNPMQYNYPIKDNMFMFGSEGSCSSSDGSCTLSHGKEIKQEENIGYHHMSSNGFDDYNNNFMISCNNGGENINQYEEKSSGVGYTNGQSQTLTPLLDYGLEDIKQLICSNNKGFNVDEIHKIEENGMYYYHY